MNPLSLLATGGRKIGGLFQAMGQNFDRNAAGPLPEILGSDYTPAMRSRARVNAIMGIGQALAGQAPLPQTLAHGQQSILAGWQMGQDLKRQKEQRAALAQLGQEMLDSPTSSSDAEALFAQAQKYDRIAARHMMGGNEKGAEHYLNASAKLREIAQKRVKQPVGEPITAMGADGKATLVQRYSDGTVVPLAGYSPEAKTQVVDLGDRQAVVDLRNPGQFMKGQTPDNKATIDQNETQFSRRFPLMERQTAATEMGARASMASAGAAQQNAATAADRLAFDKVNEAGGKPLSGEASKVASIAYTMQPEIDALKNAIEKDGAKAVYGIKTKTNPDLVRIAESVADKVGRLRSGGAINHEEAAAFMGQLVRWADLGPYGQKAAVDALQRLKTEAEMVSRGVDPKGHLDPNRPKFTMTKID